MNELNKLFNNKLINNKKAQQINRATWIFILLFYFAVLTAVLIMIGTAFPKYVVDVTTLKFSERLTLNIISGITAVPLIVLLCLYGIPFAFMMYLLAVSIFDPGA